MRILLTICSLLLMSWGSSSMRADTLAWFQVPFGEMEVVLFDQDKPLTVGNFVKLVRTGAYDRSFIHRCEPNFVAQGGGYTVAQTNLYEVFARYSNVPNFGPITNEFNHGRRISNEFGTIAMAKVSGNPHSATSQWFFNLTNNAAALDAQNGGFTVFGQVQRGREVLLTWRTLEMGAGIVNMTQWYGTSAAVFSNLPVIYSGFTPPFYPDLTYFQIRLLEVTIRMVKDGRPIVSWPSVSGLPNYVEATPALDPPHWQVVKTVVGDGYQREWIDSESTGNRRYYRVRVEY
jgi:cyclophilin family peptidyl-prolyl cis-trans isomerase